jgi:hypothetical protein
MVARELETRLFTRHFDPSVLTDALQVHANLHHRNTTNGDVTQYERLSGGFDTSLLNTTVAAFADYLALRRSTLEPERAYDLIGIHGGDDSLTYPLDEEHVQWACKQLGLTIKTSTVQKGGFVGFLGRIYGPTTWFYEPNSIVDIARTMTKFAYTSKSGELPDAELITLKAQSLMALDAHFPPVSTFCMLLLAESRTVDLSNPKYRLHLSYHLRRVIETGGKVVAHSFSNADNWVDAYMAYTDQQDWYQTFLNSLTGAKSYGDFVKKFYESYRPIHPDDTGVYTDNGPLPPAPAKPLMNAPVKPGTSEDKRGKIKTTKPPRPKTSEEKKFKQNDRPVKASVHATTENPQPASSGKRKTVRPTRGVPKEHQPP